MDAKDGPNDKSCSIYLPGEEFIMDKTIPFDAFVKANFKKLPGLNDPIGNQSFGKLSDGKRLRPFVRLDGRRRDNEYFENVYRLLTHYWRLPEPDYILEVTGSAEDHVIDEDPVKNAEKMAELKRYVRNLVVSEEGKVTWVITGGSHSGAMRLVGEALDSVHEAPCIAIGTWGNHLAEKESLETAGASKQPIKYKQNPEAQSKENGHRLDMDHDCFLLVDRGLSTAKSWFGQEIEFRNSFIDYVSRIRFAEKIPVVLLLIGGGPTSLATCNLTVAASAEDLNLGRYVEPRHLIVLSGTSRSADAIERALKEYKPGDSKTDTFAENAKAKADQIFSSSTGSPGAEKIDQVVQHLRSIAMRKHLVTVVDVFNLTEDKKDSEQISLYDLKIPSPETRTCIFVDNNFEHRHCRGFTPIEPEEKKRIQDNLLKTLNVERVCKCGRDDHPISEISESEAAIFDDTQRSGTLYFYPDTNTSTTSMLEFVPSYSKFIRLPYDHETCSPVYMDKVCALMYEFWRMQKPQMLIEVTGMATDMRLIDQQILRQLKIGLVRVAKRAKAWLIAGGTNTGVMKLLGDAVAEDRKTHGGVGVHCLGIAAYGMMENRKGIFDTKNVKDGSLVPYPYKNDENYSERNTRGNPYELNPGYDHYILVDTGKENRFQEEIGFRAKLLEYLSEQKPYKTKTDCNRTPLVLLVCGGGPGTLKTIVDAMTVSKDSRPVVILKGFGGVGDFLFAASEKDLSNPAIQKELMEDPLFATIADKNRPASDVFADILKIFKTPKLITAVDMSSSAGLEKQSLDDAIIEAIFKIGPSSGDDANWIKSSFELALKWNRIDSAQKMLVEQKYFRVIQQARLEIRDDNMTEKKDPPEGPLFAHKAMTFAIKRDQSKLFELYIKSGLIEPRCYFAGGNGQQLAVIFHKLFWHPSSWKSHKKVIPSSNLHLFKHILESEHHESKVGSKFSFRFNYDASDAALEQLTALIETIEPAFREQLGLPRTVSNRAKHEFALLQKIQNSGGERNRDEYELIYEMTVRNLFLLKLLLCRDDFAVAIWNVAHVSDFLGTAIIAVIFLENLASAADNIRRKDLCEAYQELSKKWEERSLAVIDKLSESQSSNLARILTRCLRTWHGANVLQMAYVGDRLRIMAHSAVQIELEKIWKAEEVDENADQVVTKATKTLSPRRICKMIAFTFKRLTKSLVNNKGNSKVEPSNWHDKLTTEENERTKRAKKTKTSYDIWTASAVAHFYETSPRVKFGFYTFSLLVFLFVLFGDVVITAHEPLTCDSGPSYQMIYIWVTAAMFTADAFLEIRVFDSVSMDNGTTIIGAIFMFTSFVLQLVCYVPHYKSQDAHGDPLIFSFSQLFYAISCIFFWFKCFRLLFVFKSLGAMVLTLYEMFKDVAFFTILHFIILFAFSAPIYALATMPQNRSGNGDTNEYFALMARVIYYRWWNIVGITMDDGKSNALGETCTKVLSPEDTFAEDETALADHGNSSFFGELAAHSQSTFCDFRNVVSSVLLMLFLMLTNIVLLNMLIASFSFTIQDYRDKAELLWKFGRYHLIRCFAEKPVMPPPLNIFELALVNSTIFGRCLNKRWSNTFETHFSPHPEMDSAEYQKRNWVNGTELGKFRYRELNGIEKTAISKVLDDESKIKTKK